MISRSSSQYLDVQLNRGFADNVGRYSNVGKAGRVSPQFQQPIGSFVKYQAIS